MYLWLYGITVFAQDWTIAVSIQFQLERLQENQHGHGKRH